MGKIDLLNAQPIITNRSNYNFIPQELRELGDDIEKIAKEVYREILTINWHGSIVRDDFVYEESDADFTIFIKNNFVDGHRTKRDNLLNTILPKWQNRGITMLDVRCNCCSAMSVA